jgi:hypothetical protein
MLSSPVILREETVARGGEVLQEEGHARDPRFAK